jgi:hypothetical protein
MSDRIVPIEEPPVADPALREWLSRMMILINAALSDIPDFTPVGEMPTKVTNGMVRYFKIAIAPSITSPGPWIYEEGVWRKL